MSLYNTESIHIQKLCFTQDPLYQFYPDWLSCQVQYPLLSLLVTNEYPKDTLTQWNRSQERLLAARIGTKAIIGISYSNTNQEERFSPSLTWDLKNQESKNIHVQKINQLLERQKIITCKKKLVVGKTVRMLVSGAAVRHEMMQKWLNRIPHVSWRGNVQNQQEAGSESGSCLKDSWRFRERNIQWKLTFSPWDER